MDRGWVVNENEVIAATRDELEKCEHDSARGSKTGFSFTPKGCNSPVWVKYGVFEMENMRSQAKTQAYVREELLKRPEMRSKFHIPQVFGTIDAIIGDWEYGLIVMEYVTGTDLKAILRSLDYVQRPTTNPHSYLLAEWVPTNSEDNKAKAKLFRDKISDFICFLLSLEPSPGVGPGPCGGGRMTNFIFGQYEDNSQSPRAFENLQNLQDYINNFIESSSQNCLARVNVVSEGLRMCWCDLHYSNFIMKHPTDPSSPMTIIDFEFASWLPYSVLVWAMIIKATEEPREKYVLDRVMSRAGLEQKWDNTEALNIFYNFHRRGSDQ